MGKWDGMLKRKRSLGEQKQMWGMGRARSVCSRHGKRKTAMEGGPSEEKSWNSGNKATSSMEKGRKS